ncbi:ABC transporter substrate-binding protein [Paenibacillus sp. PAMC21692]|uniref:ABC transporter substrate-binding protein n=1 Tax=Paenibacillus sp. PAMC21692 TaxID=2762320 RepID=UPI00164CFA92|nr:ABC transporter substrate-binding protein [Paenibacillus sp. PAMC21692]QNK58846.1 ABC transporter substrate-binding protein [Paenibacillus sp. PAMC21692]
MKQRKRGMHILIALGLLMTMFLQACSGNGGTPEPTQSAEATKAPAATEGAKEPELEPYEVSITYHGKPERDVALVEEKLNEFFREKINATVKLNPIVGAEYKQKTELMMNSGEKMDLVFTASWLDFFSNVTKGAFIELDELLEQYGAGIKEQLNPLYLEAPRLDGKLYAVPTNKEITQSRAITMRKDIVDKYQIPLESIKTTADLEPWMKVIKESEPDIIPNFVSGGGGDGAMYEQNSNYRPVGPTPGKLALFFYDYTKSDNISIISALDQQIVDINKSEFERARNWYELGYTNSDAATSSTNIGDVRKQGKIWYQNAVWKPGADIELNLSTNNQFEFISNVIDEPLVTTDLTTGSMFSISRTSKDPARAMMVLNYLHTDPYVVNLIVNGIEDVHYKKAGDNRIEPIADSGYGTSALFWVVGNQMINYLKPGQPDDLYTNWIQYNNEAKRSPLLGFVFKDTNVKNEITQLTAIATEYKAISTGGIANPVKLLEERNRKFEDAGIEKVRAEIQTQVDAWKAAQK